MTQENKKTKTMMMSLHPKEVWLIERWRKRYRFGEITIKMHEGIPQGITKSSLRDYPPKEL